MTHPTQFTRCHEAVQLLAEHGFEGLAQVLELLLNEAMKLERCEALQAAPYQRTDERRGYANGFKDKTMHTRVGDLHLKVPQTRDVDFTRSRWNKAFAANGPSPPRWPRCTCAAFRPARFRGLSNSCAAARCPVRP